MNNGSTNPFVKQNEVEEQLTFVLDTRYRRRTNTSVDNTVFEFMFQTGKTGSDNMRAGRIGPGDTNVTSIKISSITLPNFLKAFPTNVATVANEVILRVNDIGIKTTYTSSVYAEHHFAFMICRTNNNDSRTSDILNDDNIVLHPIPGRDTVNFYSPTKLTGIRLSFYLDNSIITFDPEMLDVIIDVGAFTENTIVSYNEHKLSIKDRFVLTENNNINITRLNKDKWIAYCRNNMPESEFNSIDSLPMEFTTEELSRAYPTYDPITNVFSFGSIYRDVIYDIYTQYNTNPSPVPREITKLNLTNIFYTMDTAPINAMTKYQGKTGIPVTNIRSNNIFNFNCKFFTDSTLGSNMLLPRDSFVKSMIDNINQSEVLCKQKTNEYYNSKLKLGVIQDKIRLAEDILNVEIEKAYTGIEYILMNSAYKVVNTIYIDDTLYYDFDLFRKFPIYDMLVTHHTYVIKFLDYTSVTAPGCTSRGNELTIPNVTDPVVIVDASISGVAINVMLTSRDNTFYDTYINSTNELPYKNFVTVENSITSASSTSEVIDKNLLSSHLFKELSDAHQRLMTVSRDIEVNNYSIIEQGLLNIKLASIYSGIVDAPFDSSIASTITLYDKSVYRLAPMALTPLSNEDSFANLVNTKISKPRYYESSGAAQVISLNGAYSDGDTITTIGSTVFKFASKTSIAIDTVIFSSTSMSSKHLVVGSTVTFIKGVDVETHVIGLSQVVFGYTFIGVVGQLNLIQIQENLAMLTGFLKQNNIPNSSLSLFTDLSLLDANLDVADLITSVNATNTDIVLKEQTLLETMTTNEQIKRKQDYLMREYKYYLDKDTDTYCIILPTSVVEINVPANTYTPIAYINELNKALFNTPISATIVNGVITLTSASTFGISRTSMLDKVTDNSVTSPTLYPNFHPKQNIGAIKQLVPTVLQNKYADMVIHGDYVYGFSHGIVYVYDRDYMTIVNSYQLTNIYDKCTIISGTNSVYVLCWNTGATSSNIYEINVYNFIARGTVLNYVTLDKPIVSSFAYSLYSITDQPYGTTTTALKFIPVRYVIDSLTGLFEPVNDYIGVNNFMSIATVNGNKLAVAYPGYDIIDCTVNANGYFVAYVNTIDKTVTGKITETPTNVVINIINEVELTGKFVRLDDRNILYYNDRIEQIDANGVSRVIVDNYTYPGTLLYSQLTEDNKVYTTSLDTGVCKLSVKKYNHTNSLTYTLSSSFEYNAGKLIMLTNSSDNMLTVLESVGSHHDCTFIAGNEPNYTQLIRIPLLENSDPFDANIVKHNIVNAAGINETYYSNDIVTELRNTFNIIEANNTTIADTARDITLAKQSVEHYKDAILYKVFNYNLFAGDNIDVSALYSIEQSLVSMSNNFSYADTITQSITNLRYKIVNLTGLIDEYSNIKNKITTISAELYNDDSTDNIKYTAYDTALNNLLTNYPLLRPSVEITNIYSTQYKQLESYTKVIKSYDIATLQIELSTTVSSTKNLMYDIRLRKNQITRYKLLTICHLLGALSISKQDIINTDENNVMLLYLLDYSFSTSVYIMNKEFQIPLSITNIKQKS